MRRLLFTCFVLLLGAGANAQLTKDQANARKSESDVASSQADAGIKESTRESRRTARLDARYAKKQAKTADAAIGGGVSPEKEKRKIRGRKYFIDANGTKTYVDSPE